MLNVKLICVGSLKEKYWREACSEYEKRLAASCRFSIVELPEFKTTDKNPSDALIAKALDEEAKAILQAASGIIIPMCIEGEQVSSEQLSQKLRSLAVNGESSISFVIGSSHGLAAVVKERGRGISMSPMTFPHQLARVMLCEQIYRAFQIMANTKYHK